MGKYGRSFLATVFIQVNMYLQPRLLDRPLRHPDHLQLDHTMREHQINVAAAVVIVVIVVVVVAVAVIVVSVIVIVGGISNQLKTISSFLEKRRLPEIKG